MISKINRTNLLVAITMSTVLLGCQTTTVDERANAEAMEAEVNQQDVLTFFNWQLKRLNGENVGKGENGKPLSVKFDTATNKVTGYAGCNNYCGSFSVSETNLTIGHLAMTRKFCSNTAELESRFAKTMTQVKRFEYLDNELHLKNSNEETVAVLAK